jgi:SAM-dependent methyltransferase
MSEERSAAHYGRDLAALHDRHFGMVARAAARELVARLGAAGFASGTVVELAIGSGISSRMLAEAGFEICGVDISAEMLSLARASVPQARLECASLWDVELPACVAVTAIGEAFCYVAPGTSTNADPTEALAERLRTIHDALQPGGVLLFDLAGPGRSGPTGSRNVVGRFPGAFVSSVERERDGLLTREIDTFVADGPLYRRSVEHHVLRLHDPERVDALLRELGFCTQRLARYAEFELLSGWHAFAATKPLE